MSLGRLRRNRINYDNITVNKMIKDSIKIQIDRVWDAHLDKQCHDEAEKYFGKNYWGLTISRRSEPEFKTWWETNKDIPYDSYYYEVAQYVWDKYEEYITP